jgi:hypothetical protein
MFLPNVNIYLPRYRCHIPTDLLILTFTFIQHFNEVFPRYILSRVAVAKDGVRIGNYIYWILRGRN